MREENYKQLQWPGTGQTPNVAKDKCRTGPCPQAMEESRLWLTCPGPDLGSAPRPTAPTAAPLSRKASDTQQS